MSEITVFGEADERTIAQLERCVAAEEGARGVLCADNHLGYSQPIGGAVAYREAPLAYKRLVALRHDRSFVGIELNPEYAAMARDRIRDDAPLLNVGAEAA